MWGIFHFQIKKNIAAELQKHKYPSILVTEEHLQNATLQQCFFLFENEICPTLLVPFKGSGIINGYVRSLFEIPSVIFNAKCLFFCNYTHFSTGGKEAKEAIFFFCGHLQS